MFCYRTWRWSLQVDTALQCNSTLNIQQLSRISAMADEGDPVLDLMEVLLLLLLLLPRQFTASNRK